MNSSGAERGGQERDTQRPSSGSLQELEFSDSDSRKWVPHATPPPDVKGSQERRCTPGGNCAAGQENPGEHKGPWGRQCEGGSVGSRAKRASSPRALHRDLLHESGCKPHRPVGAAVLPAANGSVRRTPALRASVAVS
ncbi:hypothetical protein H920_02498 [Fukomys damarensis]|uniref:Uncharacterized protein n=1 Tax=Fukomys damarensis TaxID=885580 RepID=A0A091DVI4_FUKDA|nr:hypothetical protein H920_02498 [Fukomys damarensis]